MTGEIIAQLVLGVGSSVITGLVVWLWQRARRTGDVRVRQRFLGLATGLTGRQGPAHCRLIIGEHFTDTSAIHRRDVAAMLELSALARAAAAAPTVMTPAEAQVGEDQVEFCIGGPGANSRVAAHLRRHLPGVAFGRFREGHQDSLMLSVGGDRYRREPVADHALLARICRPDRPHLFVVAGQSGVATQAAAAFLAERLPALRRRFGDDRTFCLVLRVHAPATYGHREVEEAAEVTEPATTAPGQP